MGVAEFLSGELLFFALLLLLFFILWLILRDYLKRNPREKRQGYLLDSANGRVELFTVEDVSTRLELFKLFPYSKAFGFELMCENSSGQKLEEVGVSFPGREVLWKGVEKDELKIQDLEFPLDEIRGKDFRVSASFAFTEKNASSEKKFSFKLRLDDFLRELIDEGKVVVIEEEKKKRRKAGAEKEAAKEFAEAVKGIEDGENVEEEVQKDRIAARLAELGEREKETMKSLLKREIEYSVYAKLTENIREERIKLKAQLARMEKK